MWFHGGGFMYGDLDTHDPACRFLAERSGVRVLSVDYRLAPEDPFPAAHDDCDASYRWVVEHAESLGADPARLAVGGDSAGGDARRLDGDHGGPRGAAARLPAADLSRHRHAGRVGQPRGPTTGGWC